jgi:hypothetical protein
MRIVALIIFLIPFLAFGQKEAVDSSAINRIVDTIDELSGKKSKPYSLKKRSGNKSFSEAWQYYKDHQFSRIIIDYKIDSTIYSERYYLKNGSLIYACENEIMYFPSLGPGEFQGWSGSFYFLKDKLIDHVTLGHGRSESDDWDPEKEVLEKMKRRKEDLRKLK